MSYYVLTYCATSLSPLLELLIELGSAALGESQVASTSTSISTGGGGGAAWSVVFYVFGTVGVAWYPLYLSRAYELPSDHPRCRQEGEGGRKGEEDPDQDQGKVLHCFVSPIT